MSTMAVRTLLAPFERMKLEYMLNRSTTPLIPAVKLIFAKEGARGFWKGNFVNLLRTTPYKAINFAAFDAYKGVAVMACGGDPKDVDKILLAVAGAAAGVTSVSSCFPMDVVRTRLLVTGGMKKYGGVAACIRTLYTREGHRRVLPRISPGDHRHDPQRSGVLHRLRPPESPADQADRSRTGSRRNEG
jgi:solute carrier family 25 phosphate transporter 23/24/25/41